MLDIMEMQLDEVQIAAREFWAHEIEGHRGMSFEEVRREDDLQQLAADRRKRGALCGALIAPVNPGCADDDIAF